MTVTIYYDTSLIYMVYKVIQKSIKFSYFLDSKSIWYWRQVYSRKMAILKCHIFFFKKGNLVYQNYETIRLLMLVYVNKIFLN